MNMIVCVKQVIDPEAPPASFKIDPSGNKVVPPAGVSPVVDPYAEYAVEAALKLKDASGGKVTALSLGSNQLRDIVKKPLMSLSCWRTRPSTGAIAGQPPTPWPWLSRR
jgi:electron transfer flavoprotein beta subunit